MTEELLTFHEYKKYRESVKMPLHQGVKPGPARRHFYVALDATLKHVLRYHLRQNKILIYDARKKVPENALRLSGKKWAQAVMLANRLMHQGRVPVNK